MKRFFSFLLFVLVLSITVAALEVWKVRREGGSIRASLKTLTGQGDVNKSEGVKHVPERYTVAAGPRVNVNEVDVLAAISRQRVLLAKAVVPSVVSITSTKSVRAQPYSSDPLFRLFHRGVQRGGPVEVPDKSKGSGVIISKEGHIVTNNHVIEDMDQIEVELSDGRTQQARLIGTDVDTDIAVLKIDASDLVPLPIGNSDLVEVGESVVAVGNPYGLEESVTQGIISAKGRRGSDNISALFQTDAAINPGNSGGPLVNVRGELIGINEAIFSESGGWEGVGFAIPSVTVRRVMAGILQTGRIIKSYIGVNLEDIPSAAVAKQHGLPDGKGTLVESVRSGSPAEAAQLQAGDFIQKFNGKPVGNSQDLRQFVSEAEVNKTASMELLRGGNPLTVEVRVGEMPQAQVALLQQRRGLRRQPEPSAEPPALSEGEDESAGGERSTLSGVQVAGLAGPLARHLRLPGGIRGIVVSQVDDNSPAANKLQVGDVVEQVNQKPVTSVAEFRKLVADLPEGGAVALSVFRERARMLVVISGK